MPDNPNSPNSGGSNFTAPVISGAASTPLWNYLATIFIYLINGLAFHCWVNPSATSAVANSTTTVASWTCTMYLPDLVTAAIQNSFLILGPLFTGWFAHRMKSN